MSAQDAMKRLATDELAPLLKDHRFRKQALAWNRERDDVVQIVQIQKSRYSSQSTVSFTVNLGVWSRRIHAGLRSIGSWTAETTDVPTEAHCHVRTRLGALSEAQADQWWTVQASTDRGALGGELRALLVQRAFPFLDAHGSDARLLERALAHGPAGAWCLPGAILLRDAGRHEELGVWLASARAMTPLRATLRLAALDRLEQGMR